MSTYRRWVASGVRDVQIVLTVVGSGCFEARAGSGLWRVDAHAELFASGLAASP